MNEYQRGYIDGFDAPINVAARAASRGPAPTECECGQDRSAFEHHAEYHRSGCSKDSEAGCFYHPFGGPLPAGLIMDMEEPSW